MSTDLFRPFESYLPLPSITYHSQAAATFPSLRSQLENRFLATQNSRICLPLFICDCSKGKLIQLPTEKWFNFVLNILRKKGKRALAEMICICQGADQARIAGEEESKSLTSQGLASLDTAPKRSWNLKQNYGCPVTRTLTPLLHGYCKQLTKHNPNLVQPSLWT